MAVEILKCVKQHMGIVERSVQWPNVKNDKQEAWDQSGSLRLSSRYPAVSGFQLESS